MLKVFFRDHALMLFDGEKPTKRITRALNQKATNGHSLNLTLAVFFTS